MYGIDTAGGNTVNPAQNTRMINRVIGRQRMPNEQNILENFRNFDGWVNKTLSTKKLRLRDEKTSAASFDTNFNAG